MGKTFTLVSILLLACLVSSAQTVLSFTIEQLPVLVVDAGQDRTIVRGEAVRIGGAAPAVGGSGIYTYRWTPAKWLDDPNAANPTARPDSTITYTLAVDDGRGCVRNAGVTVSVNPDQGFGEYGLSVFPNPNDGSFLVTSTKPLSPGQLSLKVFNLLGELVYSQTLPTGSERLRLPVSLPANAKGMLVLRLETENLTLNHKIVTR